MAKAVAPLARRQLDRIPRNYAAAAEAGVGYTTVTVATLEPPASLEAIQVAAKALQERHPMLRAVLRREGEALFYEYGTGPDIDVVQYHGTIDEAVESEVERVWTSGDSLGWHLLACGPHAVLTYNHAFLDGRSVMIMLQELLASLDDRSLPAADIASPLPPWVRHNDSVSVRAYWDAVLQAKFDAMIKAVLDEECEQIPYYSGILDWVYKCSFYKDWDPLLPAGGYTALGVAVVHDKPTSLRALLRAGADPLQKDSLGRSPRQLAEILDQKALKEVFAKVSIHGPVPFAGAWMPSRVDEWWMPERGSHPQTGPHRWNSDGAGEWATAEERGDGKVISKSVDLDNTYIVRIRDAKSHQQLIGHVTMMPDGQYFLHAEWMGAKGEFWQRVEDVKVAEAFPSPRTRYQWRQLDANTSASFYARCKSENTTVQGAIGAAVAHSLYTTLGGWRGVSTVMNIRAEYGVSAEALGCFVSALGSRIGNGSFWNVARDYRSNITASIAAKEHLNHGQYMDSLPYSALLGSHLLRKAQESMPVGLGSCDTDVCISNRGAFCSNTYSTRVTALHACQRVGRYIHFSVSSVDNVLFLSISYSSSLLDEDNATKMADSFVTILEHASKAPTSSLQD